MNKSKLKAFQEEVESELRRLLAHCSNLVEFKHEGNYDSLNFSGEEVTQPTRSAQLNLELLWCFSCAFDHTKDKKYLDFAHRTYHYLIDCFIDEEWGGIYHEIDYKGNPIHKGKYILCQAFGISALSEYYRVSGSKSSLEFACELYLQIEKYCFIRKDKCYYDWIPRNWIASKEAKSSTNTHLSLLNAYSTLFSVWPDQGLKAQLENLIDLFVNKLVDKQIWHVSQSAKSVDKNSKADISIGSDLELSWLLYNAVQLSSDEPLTETVREISLKLSSTCLKEGLAKNGGLSHDRINNIVDDDKYCWVQAVGLIACINSYQLSADHLYLDSLLKIWSFVRDNLMDTENGDWHVKVDALGNYLIDTKESQEKRPYHQINACIQLDSRLNSVLSISKRFDV